MALSAIFSSFQQLNHLAWHVPLVVLSIAGLYAAWSIWSFTIKPTLYPKHPKELPYSIPWLGHAPEFVSNGQGLIRRGRLYFNNTRQPFFLTVGGQRLYVLTAPEDVALAYKDTEAFTFDKAVFDLTHQFGVSKETCTAVYQRPKSAEEDPATAAGFQNPSLKSIAHLNSDYLKLQLHPGEQFSQMASKFTKLIHEWTSEEHVQGDMVLSTDSTEKTKTVSYYKWAQEVLLQVASRGIFGAELLEKSPDLFSDFLAFDDENWRLWYQMPGSKDIVDAKNRMIDAFERYIEIPREERPDMAPVIDYYERTKRAKGIPEREIATVISMLYFVTNTNTFKLSFWIMAQLLHHPEALKQVKSETSTALDSVTGEVNYQSLLDNCPFFNAVFDETLRLCSATASIRTTTKPITINGKLIPKDAQILCPFRELHWNTEVWGQDPSIWDPSRFLKNRTLNRNASYRPFGGGLSYCPGRFIARTEALLFTALVLQRFDVELKGEQKFPRYDGKPNPALMAPVAGDDLVILVKARK